MTKMKRERNTALCTAFSVCAILLLLTSCSRPPSDDTIKSAISDYVKGDLSAICDNTLRVELVEIKQIGKFNDQLAWRQLYKYWPVKARVKGTCKTKPFDIDVLDFKLYQDDYGNWRAVGF